MISTSFIILNFLCLCIIQKYCNAKIYTWKLCNNFFEAWWMYLPGIRYLLCIAKFCIMCRWSYLNHTLVTILHVPLSYYNFDYTYNLGQLKTKKVFSSWLVKIQDTCWYVLSKIQWSISFKKLFVDTQSKVYPCGHCIVYYQCICNSIDMKYQQSIENFSIPKDH